MSQSIRNVDPEGARALLEEGWTYVDVRTPEEFEAGHVPGALNVPWAFQGAGGMRANPEFLEVMRAAFGREEHLLLGCRSGVRSRHAAEALVQVGFTNLAELVTGYEGKRDAFGRLLPGWAPSGLPTESGTPSGAGYSSVRERQPR
ncbi:MAG: rhodanese-like domain-containing protein [Polyangiaceae bacterium]|nr:rhodanese-like domain-containing protein [Polyangiaceae bacterium]